MGAHWRRMAKPFAISPPPWEHLHSREIPKELGLFILSDTMLSGYLITALKYLSRERRSETLAI